MANTPGSSFIPKRSTGKVSPTRTAQRIYILSYVTYVFFFGTLLSVVGIFFLHQQAERQLSEHIALLESERESFNNAELEEIRQLDERLKYAMLILEQHTAPSRIFEELERVIVETIRLTTFSLVHREEGGLAISMSGSSEGFDPLIFQREAMKESDLLASADLVTVEYGESAEVLDGVDRDNPVVNELLFSSVTFTFEDETIFDEIGYIPRAQREVVSTQTATETESESGVQESTVTVPANNDTSE